MCLQFLWLLGLFQPLSSHLAYPGFSEYCEQQDSWCQEQDQQYNGEKTEEYCIGKYSIEDRVYGLFLLRVHSICRKSLFFSICKYKNAEIGFPDYGNQYVGIETLEMKVIVLWALSNTIHKNKLKMD